MSIQGKNFVRKNVTVEIFRVKDSMTRFGVSRKHGSLLVDDYGKLIYFLLKNGTPNDTITSMFKINGIVLLGGDPTSGIGAMLKVIYDTNNNSIVDKAEGLSNGEITMSADDFIKHIQSKVNDELNPHNINSRANITGNKDVIFKVKNGVNSNDAINVNQFAWIRNNDTNFPNQSDYFLKGFWDANNATAYPKIGMQSTLKGWFWIVSVSGTYDSVAYQEGDYIIYNGSGDGTHVSHWTKITVNTGAGGDPIYNPAVDGMELTVETVEDHGGIPKNTAASALNGKLMSQMFNDILFPTISAYISSSVSATLNNTTGISTRLEIGTLISPVFTTSFNSGLIRNGNGTSGPTVVGLHIPTNAFGLKYNNFEVDRNDDGNFSGADYEIAQGSVNSWKADVGYEEGTGDYYDNKGVVETHLNSSRIAGTKISSTLNISGRYAMFYGSTNDIIDPISSEIRNLNDSVLLNESVKTDNDVEYLIIQEEKNLNFAVPVQGGGVVKVLYKESAYADVTSSFTKSTVQVEDAGGNLQDYYLYVAKITGYTADATYVISIT